MTPPRPATIPQLLDNRSRTSSGTIHFLDASGNVTSSITLIELFSIAQRIASALVSSGLKGGGTDIIVTNFESTIIKGTIFYSSGGVALASVSCYFSMA